VVREFGKGNGVLYVNRPEDVFKKAVELSRDRQAMKGEGIKASNYVKKFSWESIVDQFEAVLRNLTKQCKQTDNGENDTKLPRTRPAENARKLLNGSRKKDSK
jgi:hypothetical protein